MPKPLAAPGSTAAARVSKDDNFADIFSKAILLSVDIGSIGSRRKISSSSVEVDADKERIGVSKSLLESPEFTAIKAAHGELRQYIYSRALPSNFKAGMYLLPNTLLEEVDVNIVLRTQKIEGLVEDFLLAYDSIKAMDAEKLRSHYDPKDYPPPNKVRSDFRVTWSYISFGVPQNLPANILTREQEKSREKLRETTEEMKGLLRAEMGKMVDHMVERLSGGDSGKPKTFKNTLVDKIKEWLDLFNDRNITDDAELDAICDQARQLLDGVDAQSIRDSNSVRSKIAGGFEKIKAQLDTMMQPEGRAIYLDDEAR